MSNATQVRPIDPALCGISGSTRTIFIRASVIKHSVFVQIPDTAIPLETQDDIFRDVSERFF
jgi:hypothetical protein